MKRKMHQEVVRDAVYFFFNLKWNISYSRSFTHQRVEAPLKKWVRASKRMNVSTVDTNKWQRGRGRGRCIEFSIWIDCFSFLVSFSFVPFSFGLANDGISRSFFFQLVLVALHLWLSLHLWSVPMHAPKCGLITVNASHEKKISFFDSLSLSLSLPIFFSLYHAHTRTCTCTHIHIQAFLFPFSVSSSISSNKLIHAVNIKMWSTMEAPQMVKALLTSLLLLFSTNWQVYRLTDSFYFS